ncbi:hypothetical protein, partial [Burkholderia pseudomallei]|uniref:hypothetical protein n=1 Tax=Burkholderia pseudomallei TaxID=28450 RepID=UPI001C4C22F4
RGAARRARAARRGGPTARAGARRPAGARRRPSPATRARRTSVALYYDIGKRPDASRVGYRTELDR